MGISRYQTPVQPGIGPAPAVASCAAETEAGDAKDARAILRDIFASAIEAVRGADLIRSRSSFVGNAWTYEHGGTRIAWPIPTGGRLLVVGAGKAAASLALGLEQILGERVDGGALVVKYGHVEPLKRITQYEGGHPVPDAAGLAGTGAVLRLLEGLTPDDRVFVALTGGASSLLLAPADGLSLADKVQATEVLLASGASISEINTIRKLLSKVKGGGLLSAIGPAQSMTLMISDVPISDPAMIGSGPTWADTVDGEQALAIIDKYQVAGRMPPAIVKRLEMATANCARDNRRARHLILAESADAIDAAAERARALGFAVSVVDRRMEDDTHSAASRFAVAVRAAAQARAWGGPATILLAGGETTLKVVGTGKGGRNQEFALVTALALEGTGGVAILAAGTDGTDGPTNAAGAFADGETCARVARVGLDPRAYLANNDSYGLFSSLGDLLVTGPTGTNVMDLVVALVA